MEPLDRAPPVIGEANLFAADTIDPSIEFVEPTRPRAERRNEILSFPVTSDHADITPESPQSQRECKCDQEADHRNTGDDRQSKSQFVYGEVGHGGSSYTGAMRPEELETLLADLRADRITADDAVRALQRLPVENLGFARLDTHRELRQGLPEAIYAEGKSASQVVTIATRMLETTTSPVLSTRTPPETAAALLRAFPAARHHPAARLVVVRADPKTDLGTVAVVSAGTSDGPVAEEAAFVAEAFGCAVDRLSDAGVAGVHRILALQDRLAAAEMVIVVAGMEGALPSIVGGMTGAPIVAVPTSVGYGSSFEGLAALLGMLNSCASGVTVVNIDNGFGAAMAALRILRARR